jgi:dolichyl-phosphate beta-glucosyltransferase
MAPDLSFIIPAYNEELRLSKTISTVIEYFSKQDYTVEIIIVDDGSSDNTIKIAKEFGNINVISQPKNMGKGAAVKRGMLESAGKYRIFSDADLSTPIYEIPKLLNILKNGYEVSIGSRAVDYSLIKKHQPFYRETMGKTFNKIVQLMVIKGISDTQCGFKGFTKAAAEQIFKRSLIKGFGFDVEILYIASKLGLNVLETPVEWYNAEGSKVSPVKDSLKMLFEILRIRNIHKNL